VFADGDDDDIANANANDAGTIALRRHTQQVAVIRALERRAHANRKPKKDNQIVCFCCSVRFAQLRALIKEIDERAEDDEAPLLCKTQRTKSYRTDSKRTQEYTKRTTNERHVR
jgi:hypothetical protein